MKIKSSLLRSSFSGAASSVIFAMILGVALVVPTRGGGNVVNATGGESGVFDAENSDNNNSNDDPDDSFGGFGETDFEVSPEDQAAGIDPQAAGATLTIGTPSLSGSAEPGGTAYARSKVTYTATDIASWALKVSYASGSSALKYEGTSGTTIGGAADKAYSSMADNTWGYAWTDTDANAANTQVYKTMPAYGSPATVKSGTAAVSSATGSVHFAAKFGTAATPGHYKTNVLLSLVATPKMITYQITYNANGGKNAPATTSKQTNDDSTTLTVASGTPTRDGYDFLGWNTSNTATTANANYAPGKTVTLTSASPTLALFAVWGESGPAVTGFGGIKKMQDMTSTICTNAAANSTGQLYDTRDDSTYTIQKLSDGKCWMTQNLRLVNYTTTTNDSQTGGITIPNAASNFTGSNNEAAYYSGDTAYGAYYSWYTATAHTGTAAMSSGEASGSICPKGWRLPKGGSSGEFQALYNKGKSGWTTNGGKNGYWIGAANATGGAFFPAAGLYNGSSSNYVGSRGYYWSSTAYNSSAAYYLSFYSGGIYPAASGSKYYGFSVRCVAQ